MEQEAIVDDSVVLGRNLRRLRIQAGLTIELLAVKAGVTSSTVERIERAVRGPQYLPRSASLVKIAEALGCRMADLWADAGDDTTTTPDDEPEAATG